jgi:hypothetical protein
LVRKLGGPQSFIWSRWRREHLSLPEIEFRSCSSYPLTVQTGLLFRPAVKQSFDCFHKKGDSVVLWFVLRFSWTGYVSRGLGSRSWMVSR